MNLRDAIAFIGGAVPRQPGTWADLGAGDGTFTRALARLLGPDSRIYAVERDPGAVAALQRWANTEAVNVIPVQADFTLPFDLPGLAKPGLEGMLFANALHFVPDAGPVLAGLAGWLRLGGRVVFVEYDRRPPSRWVPYPIPASRLPGLAAFAGLSPPSITATRRSAFGGRLYVAVSERLADDRR